MTQFFVTLDNPSVRENALAIYTPISFPPYEGAAPLAPKYMVRVPFESLPTGIQVKLRRRADGNEIVRGERVNLKSNTAPEVHSRNVDKLVLDLMRLDARNVPRNRIFESRRITVHGLIEQVHTYGQPVHLALLTGVTLHD